MNKGQIENLWELSVDRLNDKLTKWARQASLEDKRLSSRISADLQVHIINERNNTIIRAWITDISDGGFSVICNSPVDFREGERVKVRIFMPGEIGITNSQTLANTFARLKRTELTLSETQSCQKLAFEFETPQHIITKLITSKRSVNPYSSVYFG